MLMRDEKEGRKKQAKSNKLSLHVQLDTYTTGMTRCIHNYRSWYYNNYVKIFHAPLQSLKSLAAQSGQRVAVLFSRLEQKIKTTAGKLRKPRSYDAIAD